MGQVHLAIPSHGLAGTGHHTTAGRSTRYGAGVRHQGLGFLDAIGGVLGSVVGGLFGASSQSKQLAEQRRLYEIQSRDTRFAIDAATRANLQSLQAQERMASEQTRAQLAALNASHSAQLSAQRTAARMASEQLATELVAGTQAGIFGLASQQIAAGTSVVRGIGRQGATALAVVAGIAVVMAATVGRPPRRKDRRERREQSSRSPAPASPSPVPFSSLGGEA